MKKEVRTAVYDEELHIEAFHFEGLAKPFPNHFHEYYVIGLVEAGERLLSCKNQTYAIRGGDILLFAPGDSHACVQREEGALDYRGFHIAKEVMLDLAEEVTGRREAPGFSRCVILDAEAVHLLRPLHERVMRGSREFGKEEGLILLLSLLLRRYGRPFETHTPEYREEVERACDFMERHYAEHIRLDQICRCVGLSRSALLRAFPCAKGVTPYSYLENIRIGKAKKLLEQGVLPVEAALRTGFSDQSHFTNYFSRFIGLTPGAYQEIFRDRGGRDLSPPERGTVLRKEAK